VQVVGAVTIPRELIGDRGVVRRRVVDRSVLKGESATGRPEPRTAMARSFFKDQNVERLASEITSTYQAMVVPTPSARSQGPFSRQILAKPCKTTAVTVIRFAQARPCADPVLAVIA